MADDQAAQIIVRTWQDATDRWTREGTWKRASTLRDEKRILSKLARTWSDRSLSSIDDDAVQDLVDGEIQRKAGTRSINRILEVVRAILRAAVKWRWLDRAPSIKILRAAVPRLRWLTYAEAKRLIAELPEHLAPIVAFSLETGLRKRNVLDLEWSQIDLARRVAWIHADQAKGRAPIAVPLSPTAVATLALERGRHGRYVFTHKGERIGESNTRAWRNALQRAGIKRFRWHDLRHTWASWHAQAGTPLHVLQELGGWKSPAMVRVYAHLSTAHLRQHVLSFHDHIHGLGIVTRQGQDPQGLGERSE